MKFASIGAWIDNKIGSAQNSWRGSMAKKTVDDVMNKTKEGVTKTVDSVQLSASEAKDNFNTNMEQINTEHAEKGFFGKMMEVGKGGGLVGMAMKKPKTEEKAEVPVEKAPEPKAEKPQVNHMRPVEHVEGWNIS